MSISYTKHGTTLVRGMGHTRAPHMHAHRRTHTCTRTEMLANQAENRKERQGYKVAVNYRLDQGPVPTMNEHQAFFIPRPNCIHIKVWEKESS